MSATILPRNTYRVKPNPAETTPEERAARIEAFKHFTLDDYDHMLRLVRRVVPKGVCDPEEALSEALVLASAEYNGSTKLTSYIAKRAWWYAWSQHKHESHKITFSQLPTQEHADDPEVNDYIDLLIGGSTDPEGSEPIDTRFVERIREILTSQKYGSAFYARRKVLPIALEILNLMRTNADLGKGIGIDEWENAPINVPNHPNDRVKHNKKKPLGAIRKKLATTLNTQPINISYAIKSLRVSTALALREGWLDYRSNPMA